MYASLREGITSKLSNALSFGWPAVSILEMLSATLSFDWLMAEHWSSLDIDLARWWDHHLGHLHVSNAFGSGKCHDEIPATMQIISTIDDQLKDFWMRIKADPESKN